jgi:hypothetical protein
MKYGTYIDAIDDLLACAHQFDDKPHLLFSCIRRLALQFEESPDLKAEIVRLMDLAHNGKQ